MFTTLRVILDFVEPVRFRLRLLVTAVKKRRLSRVVTRTTIRPASEWLSLKAARNKLRSLSLASRVIISAKRLLTVATITVKSRVTLEMAFSSTAHDHLTWSATVLAERHS